MLASPLVDTAPLLAGRAVAVAALGVVVAGSR